MKQLVPILFAISLGFSQTSGKLEMIKNEQTIKVNINRIPVTWDLTNTNDLVYNPDVIFGVDTLILQIIRERWIYFC